MGNDRQSSVRKRKILVTAHSVLLQHSPWDTQPGYDIAYLSEFVHLSSSSQSVSRSGARAWFSHRQSQANRLAVLIVCAAHFDVQNMSTLALLCETLAPLESTQHGSLAITFRTGLSSGHHVQDRIPRFSSVRTCANSRASFLSLLSLSLSYSDRPYPPAQNQHMQDKVFEEIISRKHKWGLYSHSREYRRIFSRNYF